MIICTSAARSDPACKAFGLPTPNNLRRMRPSCAPQRQSGSASSRRVAPAARFVARRRSRRCEQRSARRVRCERVVIVCPSCAASGGDCCTPPVGTPPACRSTAARVSAWVREYRSASPQTRTAPTCRPHGNLCRPPLLRSPPRCPPLRDSPGLNHAIDHRHRVGGRGRDESRRPAPDRS